MFACTGHVTAGKLGVSDRLLAAAREFLQFRHGSEVALAETRDGQENEGHANGERGLGSGE